ncbi:MAG: DUF5682 family protein [Pirellulales bacterium]
MGAIDRNTRNHGRSESIRRAALLFGWAIRQSTATVSIQRSLREACVRQFAKPCIRALPSSGHSMRAVCCQALLNHRATMTASFSTSLPKISKVECLPQIGLSFEQLDERNGYPAGIRDPDNDRMISQTAAEIDLAATQIIVDVAERYVGTCRRHA